MLKTITYVSRKEGRISTRTDHLLGAILILEEPVRNNPLLYRNSMNHGKNTLHPENLSCKRKSRIKEFPDANWELI